MQMERYFATSLRARMQSLSTTGYTADNICAANNIPRMQKQMWTDGNNQYTHVVVTEIYDLSKFWFNLYDTQKEFQVMMEKLRIFYNIKRSKYEIPSTHLYKKLYCVLDKGNEEYHRAMVVGQFEGELAVFCVDTGIIEHTTLSNIYFLHCAFASMPQQALRGRLAGVQPYARHAMWDCDASFRFLELARGRMLDAKIEHINDDAGWMRTRKPNADFDGNYELVLRLSRGRKYEYVQDVLIAEGYAISDQDEQCTPSTPSADYEPVLRSIHLYPTFEEVEHARVPTGEEVRQCLKRGVPIYEIFKEYFVKLPSVIPTKCSLLKRNVVPASTCNNNIHIIKIKGMPCVALEQIQRAYTGQYEPYLLQRYRISGNIEIQILKIASLQKTFRQELLDAQLILSTQEYLFYIGLELLPKLIECLTLQQYDGPNITTLLAQYENDSVVWNY